jgi:hypothetical protein
MLADRLYREMAWRCRLLGWLQLETRMRISSRGSSKGCQADGSTSKFTRLKSRLARPRPAHSRGTVAPLRPPSIRLPESVRRRGGRPTAFPQLHGCRSTTDGQKSIACNLSHFFGISNLHSNFPPTQPTFLYPNDLLSEQHDRFTPAAFQFTSQATLQRASYPIATCEPSIP